MSHLCNMYVIGSYAAPDGVKPPTLTSPTPTSVQAQWQAVGRANSDQQPTFFLQYRLKTPGALIIE